MSDRTSERVRSELQKYALQAAPCPDPELSAFEIRRRTGMSSSRWRNLRG